MIASNVYQNALKLNVLCDVHYENVRLFPWHYLRNHAKMERIIVVLLLFREV